MKATSRFSTYHVPDDGTWYAPGEIVRVDQLDKSAIHVQIVKDPDGAYEVHSCRQATEYTGTPLLRVGLKKGGLEPSSAPGSTLSPSLHLLPVEVPARGGRYDR
jgi:hypothetical protein